jgi:hypothetical protein
MSELLDQLFQTLAGSRRFLDHASRREVIHFVRSRRNADGGFCGRDERSDLYYTLFAIFCLRGLGASVPLFRLHGYLQSFGDGRQLDSIHRTCLKLLRLRVPFSSYPVVEVDDAGSPYLLFLQQLQGGATGPEPVAIRPEMPTPQLAAALICSPSAAQLGLHWLPARMASEGGFVAAFGVPGPDLLSTATALFALHRYGAITDAMRRPNLDYVSTLWRDGGGFVGQESDLYEDVEYTAYALLSIGCLMG